MQIQSGSYTGNGTSQSISGLGFQPDAVFIKGGANIGAICLSTMGADKTKPMSGATAVFSGGVTSLNVDGFSLGSDARVNANTTAYFYIALRDNGVADYKVGTYNGDGLDNRNITGVGFQPSSLIICSASTHAVFWGSASMGADQSLNIGSGTLATDRIQALQADGFQLGTGSDTNANGVAYYYLAMKTTSIFKELSYTGNGVDNRSISGVGIAPDNVLTKHATVAAAAAIRFKDQVGDSSFQVNATTAAANKIQALEADGFQVGTHQSVNENLSTYFAWAMKDGATTPGAGGGGGGQSGGQGRGGGRGGGSGSGGGSGGGKPGNPGNGNGGGNFDKLFVGSRKRNRIGVF